MVALLALFSTLAATEAPAKELKIAAPGLAMTGVDAALSAPLTDHLLKSFVPIRVVTPRDVTALIGLDRQKEMLGCSGAGACLVELGNALGVQGVLLGDIVKLGGVFQINTRVIDPVQGRPLAAASERVANEEQLFDALTRVGLSLRSQFYASQGVTEPPAAVTVEAPRPAVTASSGTRRYSIIPFALGGLSLAASGIFLGLSEGSYSRLTSGMPGSVSTADAMLIAQSGKTFQTAGWVMLAIGTAALLTGLIVLLVGSSS